MKEKQREIWPKNIIVPVGNNIFAIIHCNSKSSYSVFTNNMINYNYNEFVHLLKIFNGADVYYDLFYMNPDTITQLANKFPRKRFHAVQFGNNNEWYNNIYKEVKNHLYEEINK